MMTRTGLLVAALLAGTAAHAQDNTTVIPAPGAERYSLPPGNNQATPAPVPTPAPTPAPTLTPSAVPSVVPTVQLPRTTPRVTPSTTRTASAPRPTPTPAAVEAGPAPVATPALASVPEASPAPTPVASPVVVVTQSSGLPAWLWWAAGLVLLAAAAVFAWRRFGIGRAEPIVHAPEPAPAQPLPPVTPTAGPPALPVTPPERALVLDFRPQRLWTLGPDAHLAFELAVTNAGTATVDGVRPVIALASAGPEIAAEIAAFHANAQTLPGGDPFTLRAGETRTIVGELTLPGDAMYVTSAATRELIVPVALVSLHWRAGLSLARAGDTFVIGTGDAAMPRLGPIWVDRAGLVYPKLDARRFTPN